MHELARRMSGLSVIAGFWFKLKFGRLERGSRFISIFSESGGEGPTSDPSPPPVFSFNILILLGNIAVIFRLSPTSSPTLRLSLTKTGLI